MSKRKTAAARKPATPPPAPPPAPSPIDLDAPRTRAELAEELLHLIDDVDQDERLARLRLALQELEESVADVERYIDRYADKKLRLMALASRWTSPPQGTVFTTSWIMREAREILDEEIEVARFAVPRDHDYDADARPPKPQTIARKDLCKLHPPPAKAKPAAKKPTAAAPAKGDRSKQAWFQWCDSVRKAGGPSLKLREGKPRWDQTADVQFFQHEFGELTKPAAAVKAWKAAKAPKPKPAPKPAAPDSVEAPRKAVPPSHAKPASTAAAPPRQTFAEFVAQVASAGGPKIPPKADGFERQNPAEAFFTDAYLKRMTVTAAIDAWETRCFLAFTGGAASASSSHRARQADVRQKLGLEVAAETAAAAAPPSPQAPTNAIPPGDVVQVCGGGPEDGVSGVVLFLREPDGRWRASHKVSLLIRRTDGVVDEEELFGAPPGQSAYESREYLLKSQAHVIANKLRSHVKATQKHPLTRDLLQRALGQVESFVKSLK